eukprot:TRINITY_DN2620_c0_g3_i2.p1 TRINITY_DN2620_c0_g3~~TRINITY_DN2620_c0_g3_i2.p1  ORF type:complete len:1050 (+),score=544.17 TRINITY_DN2620_c0_g3_i2:134-3151(+)
MALSSSSAAPVIDEALYSRQLYVIDHASMLKVMETNVLLIGLGGLGVEIAKGVILSGVRSVTLFDKQPTTLEDLGSQFFLSEEDVGRSRAAASLGKLRELNNYVAVELHEGDLDEETLSRFQVVVATNLPLDEQVRINRFCHARGIRFISTELHGVIGSIFVDLGNKFEVREPIDEALDIYSIINIDRGEKTIITLSEETSLKLGNGSLIKFSGVQGMEEINLLAPVEIKRIDQLSFSIDVDSTNWSPYIKDGVATEFRPALIMDFLPLEEALVKPKLQDFGLPKFDKAQQVHLGLIALGQFHRENNRFPTPHNAEDVATFLRIVTDLNEARHIVEEIDTAFLSIYATLSTVQISPLAAAFGGIVGQEVIKASSGKFTPISQFLHLDYTNALPANYLSLDKSEFDTNGQNARYSAYIKTFGKTVMESIFKQKNFLVGAGAIGCELLKNFAMIGLGVKGGYVQVTDMDTIEKSNLNRQFLFRSDNVGGFKSKVAAAAAKVMNPEFNVVAHSTRVGPDTENYFNDAFMGDLDLVTNALDNIEARIYVDGRCVTFRKPLLESGTLGAKANLQVVVPDLTVSYASSSDPPEKTFPLCTIHFYPYKIEHNIAWARDFFEGTFKNAIDNVNGYIRNRNYLASLDSQSRKTKLDVVKGIYETVVSHRATSFRDCVIWARLRFQELFYDRLSQMLHDLPLDMVTDAGIPFWSPPKRAPTPVIFDADNDLHLDFIQAAAHIRAFNFGIKEVENRDAIRDLVRAVPVPEFNPRQKVFNGSADPNQVADVAAAAIDEDFSSKLPSPAELQGYTMFAADFEKDDDSNFHIDFITAISNVRAVAYGIETCDRHKTKGIAGKIIPALITTTSAIAGFVVMELIKVVQKKDIETLNNTFLNLSVPSFVFAEPEPAPKIVITPTWSITLWDNLSFVEPLTFQEFIERFDKERNIELTMITCESSLVYAFFQTKHLKTEISKAYKSIKPDFQGTFINMSILGRYKETGADVELPLVRYKVQC